MMIAVTESNQHRIAKIAILISILSMVISAWTCYETNWRTSLRVFAGRQARLFVAIEEDKGKGPQPMMFLNICYANDGGKGVNVFDTKIGLTVFSGDHIFAHSELKSAGEVTNFLEVYGKPTYTPVNPVFVAGKSSVQRSYFFLALDAIRQEDIPKNFSIRLDLFVKEFTDWRNVASYEVQNLSDVWQDLITLGPFKEKIVDLKAL